MTINNVPRAHMTILLTSPFIAPSKAVKVNYRKRSVGDRRAIQEQQKL